MDETQFDHLTRTLTDRLSRRSLGQWGTVAAAALGLAAVEVSSGEAKKKKKKKKKCKPNCAGRTCGTDGCGGTCGSCTSTQICSNSGQCLCAPNQKVCPAGSESSCCDSLFGCCPDGTGLNGCCPSGNKCCPINSIRPNGGCCGQVDHCATNKAACCPGNFPVGCAGTERCCKSGDSCCPADKGEGCCPADNPVCCGTPTGDQWCCPSGSTCDDANTGCLVPRGRQSAGSSNSVSATPRAGSAADSPHATV